MILFKRAGVVLRSTALAFEANGVLNPAVILHKGLIHMFYRAVDLDGVSSIGYCQLGTPTKVAFRHEKPILVAETAAEKMGLEDPRIVRIDGLFYLSYTAFDGWSALGSLLFSYDLQHFFGRRIIVDQQQINLTLENEQKCFRWDKNLVFFPRRINGKIYFMHRIKPDILLSSVNEIEEITPDFWNTTTYPHVNRPLFLNPRELGSNYVGAGCPPIETLMGWVLIYHAAYRNAAQYTYKIHVALLDLNDPRQVLANLPYPVLEPETEYERFGQVDNVVFPTAYIQIDDTVYVYYGAADSCVACAHFSMTELLKELSIHPSIAVYEA
ncbi:MAG: hypothetical protein RIR94_1571 [Bacteroidota bacterium]